jgi:C-terminal processing protease CtpA/Prc
LPQICVGDTLVSIDGSIASKFSHTEIIRMVRGAAGTTVELGFRSPQRPPGQPGELYSINLVREQAMAVSQRAFGSSAQRSSQSSFASQPGRRFIVL